MRPARLRIVLSLVLGGLLLALSVLPAQGQADLINAAKREGRVVVYGSLESDVFEVIAKIFEGQYGIKVDYFRAASNLVTDRVLTESRAGRPQFDVVLTNRSPMLILKKEGVFARYTSPSYEGYAASIRDRDGVLSPSYRMVVVSILYNTRLVKAEDAPKTLNDLLDPKWKGKIGFAPSNASWQAFVTAIRVMRGEDGAKKWLEGFKANEPQKYDNNIKIRDAADEGKLALGLTNHYYWYEKAHQVGVDKMSAKLHFIKGNDPGALINAAGVAVLKSSKNQELATKFAEFLLSPESQKYFADKTAEYPVRVGVTSTDHKLVPLSELQPPDLKLADLQSLPKTAELLRQVGLL